MRGTDTEWGSVKRPISVQHTIVVDNTVELNCREPETGSGYMFPIQLYFCMHIICAYMLACSTLCRTE